MIAVLTGDIVASRKTENRAGLTDTLKFIFKNINKTILSQKEGFEIFRGDSFQGLIREPHKDLLIAVLIRAGLKTGQMLHIKEASIKSEKEFYDSRIGIGLGEISYEGKKIIESDGEAFHRSGEILEKLSDTNDRIAINTPWEKINEELKVSTMMADALIKKWTPAAAQAIYYSLLYNSTQKELSERLSISQPAIHKRLAQADASAIKTYIERYEKLVLVNTH